ncbi:MAG: MFS transporter [Actinobacteria bacterium]|nr:MAG: MFS transporter [Actinomycetota bacterium]
MLLLDITIVNVALPPIARDLNASFTDLQWVIDAYALTLATFVLNAGSLADLFGRKKVFVGGVVLFTAASALCGAANSSLFLILARAAQGIGGAIMFATSLAVAIGPLVGGGLTTWLSWRWIFFVNIPIGIATAVIAVLYARESRDPEHGGADWVGLVTLSVSLFTFVYALLRGNDKGWSSGLILGMLVGGAVLLALFVVSQWRGSRPMIDLSLFGRPAFAGAQITAFTLSGAVFAMFLYLTLYLQNYLGFSPIQTGVRFVPITVLAFVCAAASGKLTAQMPVRLLLAAGLLLCAVGLFLLRNITVDSSWTALLPGFILMGAGVGLTNPALASTAIGVVPPARAGMASGTNSTFRQVGVATGIAAFGALFEHHVRAAFPGIHGAQLSALASGRLNELAGQANQQLVRHVDQVFVGGLRELFLIGACIALAGAVLALALVRQEDFTAEAGHEAELVAG